MRNVLTLALVPLLTLATAGCQLRGAKKPAKPVTTPEKVVDYNRQLAPGESALTEVDMKDVPPVTLSSEDRAQLLAGINHSLAYLNRAQADQRYPLGSISKDLVIRSLHALAELVRNTKDEAEFNAALRSRFKALMSVGFDSKGGVLFTGYYTPIFDASLVPTSVYKYAIHKRPDDLVNGATSDVIASQRQSDGSTRPYPTRAELEASGALKALEMVYFKDPYEAYVVQVQGSAKVMLPDGQLMDVGFAGTNGHPYHPIAMDLVNEGKIRKEDLSLATVRAYFKAHPDELPAYTARNPRFIFFTKTKGGPFGSLGQPVTTDITVATDKTIFPAGAPCLAATTAANAAGRSGSYSALRLDQDTGGAIRAAGRCDLYMGVGDAAERRAGNQFAEGKLYYLLLKE